MTKILSAFLLLSLGASAHAAISPRQARPFIVAALDRSAKVTPKQQGSWKVSLKGDAGAKVRPFEAQRQQPSPRNFRMGLRGDLMLKRATSMKTVGVAKGKIDLGSRKVTVGSYQKK